MGYFDKKECDRCTNEIDTFDYNWNGGLCSNCLRKRAIKVGLIALIIALIITIPIALINFNYNLTKCNNLKSSETDYGFTNTVEINAEYNNNCYFLNNHPLALPSYLLDSLLSSIMLSILIGFVSTVIKPRGFRRKDDD